MIGTIRGFAGEPVTVGGYAQDFDFPIAAIQFSCDGGSTWTTYPTDRADPDRNVNWTFSFTPPGEGTYDLFVRSLRADGNTSPEPAHVTLDIISRG